MLTPLALATLLLAGCTKDTDDTGGATVDTGAEVGPCGLYSSAWRPNAEWDWELDPAYETETGREGEWRTLSKGSESYAGYTVYIVQETFEYSSTAYPEEEAQVEWRLACDEEGVKLVQFEGVWSRENNIGTEEGWWSADFPEPPLLQPASMEVGDSWVIDTTYDYSTQGTNSASMSLDATFSVTGQSSVTVGAGTFDALQVEVEWCCDARTQFEADSYTRMVAPDVGDVQWLGRANLLRWDPDPSFQ